MLISMSGSNKVDDAQDRVYQSWTTLEAQFILFDASSVEDSLDGPIHDASF